jgi:hypothetical protein
LHPEDPHCTSAGTVPVTPGVIPPVTPGTGTTCTTDEDCTDGQKCVDGICQDNGGGNNNCYEGDITEVCPGVDLTPYYGKTFTITDKSALDTRNQKLCDEYGDFPGDFYGSDVALKDVPLKIFEKGASSWPNQVYGGECWVLVEAQKSGDDGKPDFYVRYTDIKDYLGGGKACEEDKDCDKGFVCKDNICVKDVVDVDVEIEPLIGISMLPIDDFPEAKKFNARTVGYFGSEIDDAISKAESENLELFISYTGDIEDMQEDSQVTGYMMSGDDCKDSKQFNDNLKDFVSDYEELRKTNKKTPVIRNLGDLECAEDYIDKAKGKVADIIMFDVTYEDFPDTAKPDYIYKQKKKAAQLIKKAGEEGWEAFAIVPQVVVDTDEGIVSSAWMQDVGRMLVEDSKIDGKVVKDVFYGIIYTPWNSGSGEAIDEVKVAFMSNQPKDNAEVLALIKEEKANMIVHIGNMGYEDAKDWKSMLYGTLGEKDGTKTKLLPYLPIKGEEDSPYEEKPIKWSGYQSVFKSILESAEMKEKGFKCTYNSATMIGEKMVCTYKNLYFIVSGLGFPPLVEDQETFIKSAAEMSTDSWKICAWHKSNTNLKVGDKPESAARKYYQACIDNSAIVVNGYERNYARTKTITDLNIKYDENNAEMRTPILVTGEPDKITLANKKGLVINSGLAGGSTPYDLVNHAADDWWASYVTPNRYMKSGVVQEAPIFGNGALFMTFNADKDSNKARGEFKAKIMGEVKVLDSFEITRSITQEVPTYIYDVKDSQVYIDAFKYVFDKAKKAFVSIDRCSADFEECSTESECEAADFLWDDDNEKCVQCFDVKDCCDDCDDMVCEDSACQDK